MSCRNDPSFGPRVEADCRPFDFTVFFEDVFFACLPSGLFVLLSCIQLIATAKRRKPAIRQTNIVASAKLAALSINTIFAVAFLVMRTKTASAQTSASVAADLLTTVAALLSVPLSFTTYRQSLRPSTLLGFYFASISLLGIARLRTIWALQPDGPLAIVFTTWFILNVVVLVLESYAGKNVRSEFSALPNSYEVYANVWNRTAFVWLAGTFRLGYTKIITTQDLPHLDNKLHSQMLAKQLDSRWSTYDPHKRHSLLKATFTAFLPSFLTVSLSSLIVSAFTLSQPLLITSTIDFVSTPQSPDSNNGKGLIGAWALVYIGIAASNSIFSYQNVRFSTRVQNALTALVYQRTLAARRVDMGDVTGVSLMGTDVKRISTALSLINTYWTSLLEVGVACWLLSQQLSLAALAPLVLVGVVVAISSKISAAAGPTQRLWIEQVQARLKITSVMLSDIKAVKMLGLSSILSSIITRVRLSEIKASRGFRIILTVTVFLSISPSVLAPVVTFGTYVLIALYWKGGTLVVSQAFTSIALVTLLTNPFISLIQTLPEILQCVGCFDRLQEYFCYSIESKINNEDQPPTNGDVKAPNTMKPTGLNVPNEQTFSWNSEDAAFLHCDGLRIVENDINIVVGPVGSGKSALIQCLLGEMSANGPQKYSKLASAMAYCSQQPWLENISIKRCITGPLPYNSDWYNQVKSACVLDVDISAMPAQDESKIGSDGLNLSGGQKQRIALARAIYAKERVLLLDDVFSSIDAAFISIITDRLFSPNGILTKNKATVILATHNPVVMRRATNLVVMDEGKISACGSVSDLLQTSEYVKSLNMSTRENQSDSDASSPNDADTTSQSTREKASAKKSKADDTMDDLRRKTGDWSVYMYYFSRAGNWTCLTAVLLSCIWTACQELSTIWVKWWAETNVEDPNKNIGENIGVYSLLGVLGMVAAAATAWVALVNMISNSALRLHSDLLTATLSAPLSFFSKTDSGSILNRFSQDMELIGMELPISLTNYGTTLIACVAKVVILAIFSKYLGIAVPFIIIGLYFLQRFYLQTSRQVRLLSIEAKEPLYTLFSETVAGIDTIRSFAWQEQYEERSYTLINEAQRPQYMLSCLQSCLRFVLEMLTAGVATALVAIVVKLPDKFTPGSVGVSLVMVVGFSEILVRLISSWTKLETTIGAVSRVKNYLADTPAEFTSPDLAALAPSWPESGSIQIKDLVASYDQEGAPVIKNVSLNIKPGDHVAIVGRSGSGKSSLVLSLLRMISVDKNTKIVIDGQDTAHLSGDDLRQRLNVVTQDPFLFPGTIRDNIDPFGTATDEVIASVLERVDLTAAVESKGGIGADIDTDAWSAGQKQMLCFARAVIRGGKVLILDEAASSVDANTEALMQRLIKEEFKDSTVLAIIHRLKHIESYDQVAVFSEGRLIESGSPKELLGMKSQLATLFNLSEGRDA